MENVIEEWRNVKDFEDYEVSNFGNVKVLDKWINGKSGSKKLVKGRLLKLRKTKDGSLRAGIVGNRKQYYFFVHKLVAMAFIENSDKKECVVHLDRDNQNNKVDNLIWATWDEVREIATMSRRLSGKNYELNNHRSRKCKMRNNDGVEIEYESISEAGRKNNLDVSNIYHAVSGKYKKAYGVEWSSENSK